MPELYGNITYTREDIANTREDIANTTKDMTNTRKDMNEIRKDRARTTLTLNRNTDRRTYNKKYKRLFDPKVKRKVVVIVDGHSVIETTSICRDNLRYSEL